MNINKFRIYENYVQVIQFMRCIDREGTIRYEINYRILQIIFNLEISFSKGESEAEIMNITAI